jgi:hypothetical protein
MMETSYDEALVSLMNLSHHTLKLLRDPSGIEQPSRQVLLGARPLGRSCSDTLQFPTECEIDIKHEAV